MIRCFLDRLLRHRGEEERGAVAAIVAIAMVAIVAATAMTVDLGMQRVARSDMQSTADTVALDMARALADGITPRTTAWQAAIRSSLGGDTATLGRVPALPTDWVASDSASLTRSNGSGVYVQALPGWLDAHGRFTSTGTGAYGAVQVSAATVVDRVVMGGSGGAVRSAVAVPGGSACLSVGSTAAALSSEQSLLLGALLDRLLGSNVDASVLSGLQGIAGVNLGLLDYLQVLATEVGVGSYTGLLSTHATILQVVDAAADAVGRGTTVGVALAALSASLAKVQTTLPPVDVGSLLGLTSGGSVGLGARVNLFQLLFASLQVADGQHALDLGLTGDTVLKTLGLGSGLSLSTSISQVPQSVCGPVGSTVSTAQAEVRLTGDVGVGDPAQNCATTPAQWRTNPLGCLFNGIQSFVGSVASVDITPSIDLQLARATGTITAITCDQTNRPSGIRVTNAVPGTGTTGSGLVPLTISVPVRITLPLGSWISITLTVSTAPPPASAGRLTAVTDGIYAALGLPDPNAATTMSFAVPGDYGVAKPGPPNDTALQNLTAWVTTDHSHDMVGDYLGWLLGLSSTAVDDITSDLAQPLLQWFVGPLLSVLTNDVLTPLLGVGVADSAYTALPPTSCNASLAG